jgi:23S rRNA (adenine2503-C2)-methyltransferase
MDRKRNLEAGEIYDQVVAIARQARKVSSAPLTNIVYMGMGEPLLNYANVLQSIEHITSPEGIEYVAQTYHGFHCGYCQNDQETG